MSTRLYRPEVLSLNLFFFTAVDIQPKRAGGIYSCARDDFALLIAIDEPPRSTRLCRPEVLSLSLLIVVDIQLSRLIYRPGRYGCLVQECFRFHF